MVDFVSTFIIPDAFACMILSCQFLLLDDSFLLCQECIVLSEEIELSTIYLYTFKL